MAQLIRPSNKQPPTIVSLPLRPSPPLTIEQDVGTDGFVLNYVAEPPHYAVMTPCYDYTCSVHGHGSVKIWNRIFKIIHTTIEIGRFYNISVWVEPLDDIIYVVIVRYDDKYLYILYRKARDGSPDILHIERTDG